MVRTTTSSTRPTASRLRCAVLACALVAVCVLSTGCVQRRITIRSNPPGALVYVDNYRIGTTPVSTDFIYYGTREIRLVKDGYQTVTVQQPIEAPWYQVPPLDFVSEVLVPYEIRDERAYEFQLVPQVVVPTDNLLKRAGQLRAASQLPQGISPAAAPGPFMTPGQPYYYEQVPTPQPAPVVVPQPSVQPLPTPEVVTPPLQLR